MDKIPPTPWKYRSWMEVRRGDAIRFEIDALGDAAHDATYLRPTIWFQWAPPTLDTDGDGLADADEARDLDDLAPGIQNPFDPDTAPPVPDAGRDGLPDQWEAYYFGSTALSAGGPDEDQDGDELPDRVELALGTDPGRALSGAEAGAGAGVGWLCPAVAERLQPRLPHGILQHPPARLLALRRRPDRSHASHKLHRSARQQNLVVLPRAAGGIGGAGIWWNLEAAPDLLPSQQDTLHRQAEHSAAKSRKMRKNRFFELLMPFGGQSFVA